MIGMLAVLSKIILVAALPEWSSNWTSIMFGGLVLAIIMGTWAGAVAGGKGRSMQKWFLLGFFISFIGLIAAYVVKPITPGNEQARDKDKK